MQFITQFVFDYPSLFCCSSVVSKKSCWYVIKNNAKHKVTSDTLCTLSLLFPKTDSVIMTSLSETLFGWTMFFEVTKTISDRRTLQSLAVIKDNLTLQSAIFSYSKCSSSHFSQSFSSRSTSRKVTKFEWLSYLPSISFYFISLQR